MSNTTKGILQRTLATLTMASTVVSLAGFAAFPLAASAAAPADFGLKEGDVIRATGDVDLYIVNELGYKRLFVNPAIFNLYGHLGWSKVKEVAPATRDAFPTSGLFRNCESGDAKVYGLDVISEDVANLRWVNTSGAQAVADDANFFKKVFCINNAEMALYGSGAAYTSVLQVPDYSRQIGSGPVSGAVSFSANANQGGSIIAGAAQVPVLNFRVSNGASGAVSLDMLKFVKTGVVSDANISNAYLAMGGKIVAQYSGLSGGVLSFSGTGITVQPGQSVDLTLRVDISTGTSNGNTIGFNLNAASDVTLSGGASVAGAFPVVGGSFVTTSVSNPSLASIGSFAYQTVGSEVDAGTQAFRAGALSFAVSNNPVKVQSMRFTISGSVTKSTDLKNAVLKVDGVQVSSTAMVDGDYLYFDMASNQPVLNTGTHQVEVYLDVLGTPNRTFKLEILRPYDWLVWDTQYNTNISGGTPTGTATTVSVRAGTSTATLASDTPTGSLAKGASNVTIAKFRIYAAGEGLRVKWLPFQLDVTGSVSAPWTSTVTTVDDDIRNISMVSDDGSQIGTTINTPSSCTYGTAISTTTTYKCSFGSSSSNINYIIPANTARVLSLKLDIQSSPDDLKTIKGTLLAPANSVSWTGSNYEGQVSFQTGSLPAGNIGGSALNISQTPFQAAVNSAVGTQVFVAGTNQAKLGSYSLSASNAEGVNVTSVTVLAYNANGANLKVQNLRVKNGSTEWNFNVPTVTASSSYTFSSPSGPTLIPAGGSLVLDVYGDVLTNSVAGTYNPTRLTGAVGFGASTNASQTVSGTPVTGQNVTVSAGGTVTTTMDNSTPPVQQIVLGATDVALATIRFAADNVEDIRINSLEVFASSSANVFGNLRLFDSSNAIVGNGTALSASTSGAISGYTSNFSFGSSLIIPKNTTRTYTLKGDVADYSSVPAGHLKAHTFRIHAASDVEAYGNSSNQASTVSGLASALAANTQTTLRTKLTAALALMGSTTHTRSASDDVALLTLSVDPAFGAEFASVSFTLSGSAASNSAGTIDLIDYDTGVSAANTTLSTGTSYTAKLVLGTQYLISGGASKKYKVRLNTASAEDTANSTDSLSLQIATAGALEWELQGGSDENLYLQAKDVPLTVDVSYN
ncbi:MAG: hypothetical protein IT405_03040 [Candidatus Yanofskybacteria bacterium]|nr:hypothetical protein [Candidatus Yanofskybacteria bacterium]